MPSVNEKTGPQSTERIQPTQSLPLRGCVYLCMKLLWLLFVVCAASRQGCSQAIPRQAKGVKPCPALKAPRVYQTGGRKAVQVQVMLHVDVDGAPNAYGPRGKKALDNAAHAHAPKESGNPNEIVGYMTEYDGGPPTIQGRNDPYPGYYVSQTDFFDRSIKRQEDPRRYVDAAKINYVVLGRVARKNGVNLGDFATVYSCRTGKSAYAIVADSGNESGEEGSLALVQALGYNIHDGIEDSVDNREIVLTYFPGSNPQKQFFRTEQALDQAAARLGLPKP